MINATKQNGKEKAEKSLAQFKWLVFCFTGLMLLAGVGFFSYNVYMNAITSKYGVVQKIVVEEEGITIKELSQKYLPEINKDIGIGMIKKANGFVSDDIIFLKGQKVKMPAKTENTVQMDSCLWR